jgi:hypothetical protein
VPKKTVKNENSMSRKKKFRAEIPVSVLMPEELQRAIVDCGEMEDRSFSGVVRVAVRQYIEARPTLAPEEAAQ